MSVITQTSTRAFVGFYTTEEIAGQLRRLAANEDRSVSSVIRRAVAEHLEQAPIRTQS